MLLFILIAAMCSTTAPLKPDAYADAAGSGSEPARPGQLDYG